MFGQILGGFELYSGFLSSISGIVGAVRIDIVSCWLFDILSRIGCVNTYLHFVFAFKSPWGVV